MDYRARSPPEMAGGIWAESPGMKMSDAIVDLVPGVVVVDLSVFDDGWSPDDQQADGTASCMGRRVDLDDPVKRRTSRRVPGWRARRRSTTG